ncbi:MAG: FecR domain-containing protein [bacterium]
MKSFDLDILINHLTGVSSESDEQRLAEWIAESEENRKFYDRIKAAWFEHRSAVPKPDTEKALKSVLSRIEQTDSVRSTNILHLPQSGRKRPHYATPFHSPALRAAAVLIIMFGALYLYLNSISERDAEKVTLTSNTMQSLVLSDGSRITVDAGSSLTYPQSFNNTDLREVYLQGEAYFEAAKNADKPFIVHANGGKIEVLGTLFAIRAWEANRNIVVAVNEGRISFQTEGNTDTAAVVYLTKNTMSTLGEGGSLSPPAEIDFSNYISWMKKEKYFQNTPIKEVFQQLERWYQIQIVAADSALYQNRITIFIENKPLEDNLHLLSILLGSTYKQHGDTIRFVPQ